MAVRPATADDADAIAAIYNHYVDNTVITFEETPVSAKEMQQRIVATQQQCPFFVFEQDRGILGYAYATQWRERSAYRFAVESTVYLNDTCCRRGIGTTLYGALVAALREQHFHCAMGGIALPNAASVALHEKLGFTQVAHFKQVGRKFDQWIDVGYWQLLL